MPLLFWHISGKERGGSAMRSMLHIQCAVRGLLTVNGQFCGPVDGGGQTFPAAQDAEIFIEYTPLAQSAAPLALELVLAGGEIARLEPAARGYALLWPDGVIQLELRPDAPGEPETGEAEQAAQSVLLRYLALRLAGDAAADALLMHPAAAKGLPAYDAVVPLRFAPLRAPERFDERAGLVVRLAPNIARVNAALAVTVPTGQGKRLIEQIEVM